MQDNRRPVASREVNVFQVLAKKLVSMGLTPNQISVFSALFALLGGWAFAQLGSSSGPAFYAFAILVFVGIQLRLICNLIDGLMAVEGGLKTPTGEMFNDVPDRFSDLFLLVGASMSLPPAWGLHLGWAAAAAAILTAYVRVLGASMGQGHDFKGPMAKQHRMAILNLCLLAAVVENIYFGTIQNSLGFGLVVILAGSLLTVFARLKRIANKIHGR